MCRIMRDIQGFDVRKERSRTQVPINETWVDLKVEDEILSLDLESCFKKWTVNKTLVNLHKIVCQVPNDRLILSNGCILGSSMSNVRPVLCLLGAYAFACHVCKILSLIQLQLLVHKTIVCSFHYS